MTKSKCGAELELEDRTLVCELPEGHVGPTHRDGNQEWGDQDFPAPGQPDNE